MEARSITRIDDTIKTLINQDFSEQINETMIEIQRNLAQGNMNSASNVVRDLTRWFEEKVWAAYFKAIFECSCLLKILRTLAGKKGYHLVSYQEIMITLSTGTKIEVRSPFFVKSSSKCGRKKRGPQKRGAHLLLSLLGFIDKVDFGLAVRAIQLALIAPSFKIASDILKDENINLSQNKIRRLVNEFGAIDDGNRVNRLLENDDPSPLENERVLIAVDGGRLRQRKNKKGRIADGKKRHGFYTDWIEPKLFTIYLLDDDGNIKKEVPPFVDGTTGKLKEFLSLLQKYLERLGINKATEVILLGDGAPWIWERIPALMNKIGGSYIKLTEIIDWTHAKQNFTKAFELLSKKNSQKVDFSYFKELLYKGEIQKIVSEIKSLLNLRSNNKFMKKMKSYFVSNCERMQYESCQEKNKPIGSGVIESAIRRVINLRLKSPGSFWKLPFAETMLYLRSQLLYGRWNFMKMNWNRTLVNDFASITAA